MMIVRSCYKRTNNRWRAHFCGIAISHPPVVGNALLHSTHLSGRISFQCTKNGASGATSDHHRCAVLSPLLPPLPPALKLRSMRKRSWWIFLMEMMAPCSHTLTSFRGVDCSWLFSVLYTKLNKGLSNIVVFFRSTNCTVEKVLHIKFLLNSRVCCTRQASTVGFEIRVFKAPTFPHKSGGWGSVFRLYGED